MFRTMFRKFMLFIGIFLLSGNLVLASVPRCSLVKEVWNSLQDTPDKPTKYEMSCHQPAPKPAQEGARWVEPGLCQCHLLSGLVYALPPVITERDYRFVPTSERVLVFPLRTVMASNTRDVESPPPRT